ncbi:MAG: hypothetical protein RR285_00155 [Acinetobacter sp.]
MNKFRLIQALRLAMLETRINEFAESNELLSVSIFRSADAFVAGVVYKEPVLFESPDKHPAIKLEYQLECKNVRIIYEADGIRAFTKDKLYSVGGNGTMPMFHTVEHAIEALVKQIETDRECVVKLVGFIQEVDGFNGR